MATNFGTKIAITGLYDR